MPASPFLKSPQIEALKKQLAAGDADTLSQFWEQIARDGAPLIETIENDYQHLLVTFVWREPADDPAQNVTLIGALTGKDLVNGQLEQLPGSDVWYRSYKVRNDLRTIYYLSPNNPLQSWDSIRSEADWQAQVALWKPDPLNPLKFLFPADPDDENDREQWASRLELPAAEPQHYVAMLPDVPAGTYQQHRLHSHLLGNERRVWVYTPPYYSADDDPYILLILFDGWSYVELVPTPIILDNLMAANKIPPVVAVLLDHPKDAREDELSCNETFSEFVATELLAWVRSHYNVSPDAEKVVVGGSNLGGLAATFLALTYSDRFGNVLSQSGDFRWKPESEMEYEWLTRQFVAQKRLPLRFYLDVGLLETQSEGDAPSILVANRHLRNVLQAKGQRGYEVYYKEFSGADDYISWQGTFAGGLQALIGFESFEPTIPSALSFRRRDDEDTQLDQNSLGNP